MQDDAVIEAAEAVLKQARDKVQFAETRLERVRGQIVHPTTNNVRSRAAAEAAARSEEMIALHERVKERERQLQHARDDAPRRAQERARAEKLEAEAADLDRKVADALAALEAADRAHADKVRDLETARHRASRTKHDLDRLAEREGQAKQAALRARMGREPTAAQLDRELDRIAEREEQARHAALRARMGREPTTAHLDHLAEREAAE